MGKRIPPSRLLDVEARRICLIKPSALGDVVQTLPLLPVLRERFPRARIAWVVNAEYADLLDGHPQLDEIIRFQRRGSWGDWIGLLRTLRRRRFDLVFDLQGLLRTGVMTASTGAAVRVGLETAREGANLACNCIVPDTGREVPAHLRYWQVAEAIGMGERRREPFIEVPQRIQRWAREQVHGLSPPLLAVHPGARWITKRWPVEKFAAIAAKAVRLYGASVVILGSPGERKLGALFEEWLRRFVPSAKVCNLAGRTTLKQLAAVLQSADVLLTNDSGPMHLADALGTPVLGLFTCTSPLRSGPAGERHELVTTTVPCAGSYRKRCPYWGRHHLACHAELSTARVWQGLVRLMDRQSFQRRAA